MNNEEQLAQINRVTLQRCSQFFHFPSDRRLFTVVGVDLANQCLTELHPPDYDLRSVPENPMDGADPVETGRMALYSYTCTERTRIRLSSEFFLHQDEALDWADLLRQSFGCQDAIRRRIRWMAVAFTWNDLGAAWITAAYPLLETEDVLEVGDLLKRLGGAHPLTEVIIEVY